MTAGSGILHQEMPKGDPQGKMHGFQLWANLPSSHKMMHPRYQDIVAQEIPEVTDDDGTHVRIICGNFWEKSDPWRALPQTRSISISRCLPENVNYFMWTRRGMHLHTSLKETDRFEMHPSSRSPNGAYRIRSRFRSETTGNRSLVLFDSGDEVSVQTGDEGIRFLLVSGKPIEEPIAW